MIVHENAWHLKLVQRYDSGFKPRDLCSYFWTVVGTVLLTFGIIVTAPLWFPIGLLAKGIAAIGGVLIDIEPPEWLKTVAAVILITVALAVGVGLLVGYGFIWWLNPAQTAIITGAFVGFAVVAIGFIAFIDAMDKKIQKKPPKPKKKREPSLVMAFLKAKKRHICPLIEVQAVNAEAQR